MAVDTHERLQSRSSIAFAYPLCPLAAAPCATFGAQNTTVQAGPAGSVVTLNDTALTTDQWNMAAVELTCPAQ